MSEVLSNGPKKDIQIQSILRSNKSNSSNKLNQAAMSIPPMNKLNFEQIITPREMQNQKATRQHPRTDTHLVEPHPSQPKANADVLSESRISSFVGKDFWNQVDT